MFVINTMRSVAVRMYCKHIVFMMCVCVFGLCVCVRV